MAARSVSPSGFLATIVATVAIGIPIPSTATQDQVALTLKDSIALIGTDDRAATAGLQGLATTEEARPLRDVALYFLARAERRDAPQEAATHLESLLSSFPHSPLAARAATELVEIDASRGEPAALGALLQRHTGEDTPRGDAARLALVVGERLAATDVTAAARALQRARQLGRGDRASKDAARLLYEIREAHPELAPQDAQAMYEEAKLAAAENNTEEQTKWLDLVLSQFPSSPLHGDALLLRARVIARTGGRPAAASWLESRAKGGPVSLRAVLLQAAANNRWNADEDERALADFEQVISFKVGGRTTQEAHYSIGRIHESHQRYVTAAAAYRRAREGVDETLAAESDWRAGWSSYLAGKYSDAAKAFGEMAGRYLRKQPKSGRESALYWQARSTERAGRSTEAVPIYRQLLAEFPDGYYAYVTERRTDLAAIKPQAQSLPPLLSPSVDDAVREQLLRIAILNAAGLFDVASIEVDRLVESADLAEKRFLLPELARLGAHGAALRTALELYRGNKITEAELYTFLYPDAFSHLVERESTASGIDPYLVYGLMKQESLFDPRAVSPAFAYGLMQLLPSTAQRVAGKVESKEIAGEDLFDPGLNIRLGTAYLAELSQRFGGEFVFMLAGYNAGETAADTWRARYGSLEIDELIERITYRETREYVKKVLANHRNYLRLYGDARPSAGAQAGEQTPR